MNTMADSSLPNRKRDGQTLSLYPKMHAMPDLSAATSPMSSPHAHDQLLQLWVDHGCNFTRRATDLTSAWNVNAMAAAASIASTQTDMIRPMSSSSPSPSPTSSTTSPSSTRARKFSSRIAIARSQSTRHSIRILRQKRQDLLLQVEQQRQKQQHQEQKQVEAEAARLKKLQQDQLIAKQRREAEQAQAIERQRQLEQQQRAEEQVKRLRELEEQKRQLEEQARLERERKDKEEEQAKLAAEQAAKAAASLNAAAAAVGVSSGDPLFKQKVTAWEQGPKKEWTEDPSSQSDQSDENLQHISNALTAYDNVVQYASSFRTDPAMKRPRLNAKRVITRAVNQSSGTLEQAQTKIIDILRGIRDLETIQPQNSLSMSSSASSSPMSSARAFGMVQFTTQVLLEANNSIAGNKELAYGLAALIVGVTAGHPDPLGMRNVMLGAIYQKCVFCRPHFPSRRKGEDKDAYRKRLGYKDDGDEIEKEEDFLHRNRAYIHLIAAMFQTNITSLNMPNVVGTNNPFPITFAWTFIARIVNRRQRKFSTDVAHAFLETAGYAMSKAFGAQFAKLMATVKNVIIMHASPYASTLSLSNMTEMVTEFEQNGFCFKDPPKGRDLPLRDRKNT